MLQPEQSDTALWQRLQSLNFDEADASLSFSARLARENGWSRSFALAAVEEYRRFVYLACTAGHEVTPSHAVDQVWHLHLVYTRHYWQTMCDEILRRPLHHGPTSGGKAENSRYRDSYAATLAAYTREFGTTPNPAFWPDPDTRFANGGSWQWINRRDVVVVRRGRLLRAALAGAAGLALTFGLAATSRAADGPIDAIREMAGLLGMEMSSLVILIVAFIAAMVAIRLWRGKSGGGSSGCGSGCSSGGCSSGCSSGCSGCGGGD